MFVTVKVYAANWIHHYGLAVQQPQCLLLEEFFGSLVSASSRTTINQGVTKPIRQRLFSLAYTRCIRRHLPRQMTSVWVPRLVMYSEWKGASVRWTLRKISGRDECSQWHSLWAVRQVLRISLPRRNGSMAILPAEISPRALFFGHLTYRGRSKLRWSSP